MAFNVKSLSPAEFKALEEEMKQEKKERAAGIAADHPEVVSVAEAITKLASALMIDSKAVLTAVSVAVLGPRAAKGKQGQKTPVQEACRSVGIKFNANESIPALKAKLVAAGYRYSGGVAVKQD